MKDIATKSTTNYILEKYDLYPKKKYGQNFLIDPRIVEKIVCSSSVDKECAVIEVGPGIGALTQVLARYAVALPPLCRQDIFYQFLSLLHYYIGFQVQTY